MEMMFYFSILVILLGLGYFFGSHTERKHYASIKSRELLSKDLIICNVKKLPAEERQIIKSGLVTGSAVISLDYFKRIIAAFVNIFGGEMKTYETLMDRAKREAILRMKEKAKGADMILNVRIETSSIGSFSKNKDSIGCFEVLAYGTAVKFANLTNTEEK